MSKIKHIAIATQEPSKTAKFYKEVFDLEEVGRVDNDNAEGFYLSDGNVNLAILKFKNEDIVGEGFDTNYSGIHHIGFHVEDAEASDERLKKANARPMDKINHALHNGMGSGHGRRNVELKYGGPDGVMIDISQTGWVGTDSE